MSTTHTTIQKKNDCQILSKKLTDQLLSQNSITSQKIDELNSVAKSEGITIDALLKKSGTLSEADILNALSKAASLPFTNSLKQYEIDFETIKELTTDYVVENNILPLLDVKERQVIATSEPLDQALLEMISFVLERPVKILLAPTKTIREQINFYIPTTKADLLDNDVSKSDLKALANEAPVISHLHQILSQAVDVEASDIHFESTKNGLKTRFRINGTLTEPALVNDLPADAIISRLKYLAKINISERRKPQDGRIPFMFNGKEIDLRLSILPTQYGQSAVIRILDQSTIELKWAALGYQHEDVRKIKNTLSRPNGLFLVTGPTGSGKTTTLYTALNELNTSNRKIFTIEDPIEYNLAGANQVQVNEQVGLTFGTALRSILRQDPNIILIGEIRDIETAEMACRAALVGRLVLSTLHTNSPEQAKTRLLDLGVAEYLVDAVMIGVLGQTLDVQGCISCSGTGCEVCNNIGTTSRTLNYSLIEFDE